MPYEPEFHRQGAVLLTRTGDASVWQFRNETGEDTMTTYELFPGVALSFNDFHMASFDSSFSTRQRLFAVDYCREGRMEYAAAAAAWPRSRPRWATAMPASLRPPLKRRPAARRWNTGSASAWKHKTGVGKNRKRRIGLSCSAVLPKGPLPAICCCLPCR